MPALLPTINGEGAVLKPQPVFYTIFKTILSFRKNLKGILVFRYTSEVDANFLPFIPPKKACLPLSGLTSKIGRDSS